MMKKNCVIEFYLGKNYFKKCKLFRVDEIFQ